ncbi:MAG: ATP-dependent metallopeptidase FtsH/Yme1/Tma family protein, partial [Pyrinomonadaceae bacterium]
MSSTARQIIFWVLIVVGALLLYQLMSKQGAKSQPLLYSQLVDSINKQTISKLTIEQSEVVAKGKDGRELRTPLVNEQAKFQLMDVATKNGIEVEEKPGNGGFLYTMLIYWAPFILLIGF